MCVQTVHSRLKQSIGLKELAKIFRIQKKKELGGGGGERRRLLHHRVGDGRTLHFERLCGESAHDFGCFEAFRGERE